MQTLLQEILTVEKPDFKSLVTWYVKELAEFLGGKVEWLEWSPKGQKRFLYAIISIEEDLVENEKIDYDVFRMLLMLEREKKAPRKVFIYVFDWRKVPGFLNMLHAYESIRRRFRDISRKDYVVCIGRLAHSNLEHVHKVLRPRNIYYISESEILSMYRSRRLLFRGEE